MLCSKYEERSLTSFNKMKVEHFINEMIYKFITLRFLIQMWYMSYFCGWFLPNMDIENKNSKVPY